MPTVFSSLPRAPPEPVLAAAPQSGEIGSYCGGDVCESAVDDAMPTGTPGAAAWTLPLPAALPKQHLGMKEEYCRSPQLYGRCRAKKVGTRDYLVGADTGAPRSDGGVATAAATAAGMRTPSVPQAMAATSSTHRHSTVWTRGTMATSSKGVCNQRRQGKHGHRRGRASGQTAGSERVTTRKSRRRGSGVDAVVSVWASTPGHRHGPGFCSPSARRPQTPPRP